MSAPARWGLTGETGSGRKRVGIACRALSCGGLTIQGHLGELRMAHAACLHVQARVCGTDVECGSRSRIRLYRLGLVDPMISLDWGKVTRCWQLGQALCRNEPNVERNCLHVRTLHRGRDLVHGHAMRQEYEKIPEQIPRWHARGMWPSV